MGVLRPTLAFAAGTASQSCTPFCTLMAGWMATPAVGEGCSCSSTKGRLNQEAVSDAVPQVVQEAVKVPGEWLQSCVSSVVYEMLLLVR